MKIKHINGPECQKCNSIISGCDPELQYWFDVAKEEFQDLHVSHGYRDEIAQNALVAQGKSRLKFPYSEHNVTRDGMPCSKAMDLFRLTEEGKAEFGIGFYFKVNHFFEEMGAGIDWGGTWKIVDGPHFELKRR